MTALRGAAIFIFDIVKIVVISLAIIVPIRTFIVQPFTVWGDSMTPNYESGDYLFINEISYRFSEPERGDVVILKPPHDSSRFFIKRIVGLPGESLKIEDGKVFVGEGAVISGELRESYLLERTPGSVDITLDDDHYFVMGDNRNASSDSRTWGALERDRIIGKAWIRAWPFKKFEIVKRPVY